MIVLPGLFVPVDDALRHRAEAIRIPADIARTIGGERSRVAGSYGEAAFERAALDAGLPVSWRGDERGVDFATAAGSVEVKSKRRAAAPLPHHEFSVEEYQRAYQMPDWYVGASVTWDDSAVGENRVREVWIVGCVSADQFGRQARRVEAERMGSGNPNPVPMWNLRHDMLLPLDAMLIAAFAGAA